jgi:hypothetical protein
MQRLLLMFLFGIFLFSACEKEPEPEPQPDLYLVDITVLSPEENAVLPVNEAFTVKVQFDRDNNTIHNILIEIRDQEEVVVEKVIDAHVHIENTFTYEKEVILSDPGLYTLVALTSDHGEQAIQRELLFTVE